MHISKISFDDKLDASRLVFNEKVIGKGGFSSILTGYLACSYSRAYVFVKSMKVAVKQKNIFDKDNVKIEVQILRQLRHEKFIVDIYAIGYKPNGIRYALTLCMPRAISYFTHLLPLENRIMVVEYLAHPILSAVKAVHEAGFYHRDIKPQNVLLTYKGVPKLIDFGLASPIDKRAPPCGTWMYMAPELFIEGNMTNMESETYACGVTFGNMIKDVYRVRKIFKKYTKEQAIKQFMDIYTSPNKIEKEREFDTLTSHHFMLDRFKEEEVKCLVKGFIWFDPCKRTSISLVLEDNRSKEILTFWEKGKCDDMNLQEALFFAKKQLSQAIKKSKYGKKKPFQFY